MSQARPFFKGMRAAIVFLTRVPVGGFPYARDDWRWASAHFPMVGALLGAAMACVFIATSRAGSWVAACVTVAVGMLLTGAFHEDGLADTADALGGSYDREKLFVILKDSRVGAFGAAALAIVLMLRVALLARLGAGAPFALIVSQALARTPPVWLMVAMPYVHGEGESKSRDVTRAGLTQGLVATGWGVATATIALALHAISPAEFGAIAVAAGAVAIVCGYRFHVRAGGITGDFLGATEQLAECAILLALALVRG